MHIQSDIRKNTITLFLAEVLYRCLREEEENPDLFTFLIQAIESLENAVDGISNFHLIFLVLLSRYLGFNPGSHPEGDNHWFDLREGIFVKSQPSHKHTVNPDYAKLFGALAQSSLISPNTLNLSTLQRDYLLDKILEFYQLHLEKMGTVKSLEVLRMVFH